jgi:hypothetical protein
MTVKPEEAVFRHFPLMYRKAGQEGTAAFALAKSLGQAGGDLERASRQVMQSRFIDHVNDMDDLQRLAALFELATWPEEEMEEFRFRVKQLGGIYLGGAATARALLQVLGAACDSELTKVEPPPFAAPKSDARFETVGTLQRRTADSVQFKAKVVDVPRVLQEVTLTAPTFEWLVENDLYDTPGGIDEDCVEYPPTFPDPVVDLKAGDHPVVLPILVQRDLRRLVLVNRFIPPGATLRVDLVNHTLMDIQGPPTLAGPVRFGITAPALLYGTAGLVSDTGAGDLSGPADRPFHVIRWLPDWQRTPGMPEVPGAPGTLDPVPSGKIPWPELLPLGTSRWSLLVGVGPGNEVPALDAEVPHTAIRALPPTAALGPEQIQFRWIGRRLATFTVIFDEAQLCDGPAAAGPMPHRKEWFQEQVRRLKLAGIIYIDQSKANPKLPAPAVGSGGTGLSLWEDSHTPAALNVAVQTVSRERTGQENLVLVDQVKVNVSKA